MKELLLAFSILLSSIICNSQTWEKSFTAGDFDHNGQYLGGPYGPKFELF